MANRAALLALLVLGFALSDTNASAETVVHDKDSMEPALVDRINDVRASHGLKRLKGASALKKAATRHSNSMGSAGYFKHDLYTPARSETWTEYGEWIHWYWPGDGYSSWSAGENVAWGSPDLTARKTVKMWMNSAPHRANLLSTGWRRLGVSAVHVWDPLGYFGSWTEVTIVTAEFGRRS